MELSDKVKKKIQADLLVRSIKNNVGELPNMGESQQEYDYSFCTSAMKGDEDLIFVVSTKMIYHNQSLKDTQYGVYPYDKEGNYIKDYDFDTRCTGTFFKNLKKI